MIFDHVGIINEDEDKAVSFYQGILGLEKIRESSVSRELAKKLFALDQEIGMLCVWQGRSEGRDFHHIRPESGLIVGSTFLPSDAPELDALLEKAKKEGVKVISAERGSWTVHFVEDFLREPDQLKRKQ